MYTKLINADDWTKRPNKKYDEDIAGVIFVDETQM